MWAGSAVVCSLSPQELHAGGAQGDDAAGQPLALHQRGGRGQLLGLHQPAGDARGRGAGPRGDDDTQAVVAAAPHGAAAGVHHEAHQEAEGGGNTHTHTRTRIHVQVQLMSSRSLPVITAKYCCCRNSSS